MRRASIHARPAFSKIILAAILFLSALSLTGCDEKTLVCIGKEEEIQIGDHFTAGMLHHLGGEANDVETQTLITRVGKTIADKCDRKDMPWEFYYVNSDVPNAFSLPGHIFVTKGLVDLLKGDDGQVDVDMLAGILGHEVSHVIARHIARQVAEKRLADLAEAGLDLLTRRDVTADESAQFLRKFLQLGYSRNLEQEADHLGAIYAARAGYARDGLLRAGERFLQKEQRYPEETPWYFMTHPYWKDRVKALELETPTLDDETINQVAYTVKDQCSGWWGLLNIGVQYVRAKYILKSGAQIELADLAGLGYPDTVIRSDGKQKTWYGVAGKGEKGLWQVGTTVGANGKPVYTSTVGYSPQMAQALKQKATTLLARGQIQLAIKELNRAIEMGVKDADTRLQLARAYQRAGNVVGAKEAYRSVLRKEWEGQASIQASTVLTAQTATTGHPSTPSRKPGSKTSSPTRAARNRSTHDNNVETTVPREMNEAEKATDELNRTVEEGLTGATGKSSAGAETWLNKLEDEVWKKLHIPADENGNWKQTWNNAQAILQEIRRQIAAGRKVHTLVMSENKEVIITNPADIILFETYVMAEDFVGDPGTHTGSGKREGHSILGIIDDTHIKYQLGGSGEELILAKGSGGIFTAHFAKPGIVPWNGLCEATSMDISIQIANGRIQDRIVVQCDEGGTARLEGGGNFIYAMLELRTNRLY